MNVIISCEECGREFERRIAEVRRSQKLGRKQFCNKNCAGKNKPMILNRKNYTFTTKGLKANNRRDEFSDYRPHLVRARARDPNTDLTLEYLKGIWEEQGGVCPITGGQMIPLKVRTKASIFSASLDRVDNTIKYRKENVRFTSLIANYARHGWSDKELITFCHTVSDFHRNRLPLPPL
jgi:hypothetical protein